MCFNEVVANVFGLGEVGDFNHKTSNEAPNSNLVKSVIRSTEPPILPNPCYMPFFLFSSVKIAFALAYCIEIVITH
jgi:hypothetical protein